jgi:phenylpropionate dioxygenase-like ring-hydroxylating dioxygenase large terminal subunit
VIERATQLDGFWYVVARSDQLPTHLRGRPLGRRVNGRRLVLFRDAGGSARALDARCPHRGADLTGGRVKGGCLQCPYHGWRFDGEGRCTAIPSNQPGQPLPRRSLASPWPIREQQGFIWVRPGQGPEVAPPPWLPELDELDDRRFHSFHHDEVVPVPFDWWIENTLDVAHVPFVHQATYGGQSQVVDGYPVEALPGENEELGFRAQTVTRQRQSLLARMVHGRLGPLEMKMHVTHHLPGTTSFHVALGPKKEQRLLFFATPEDDRTTRVWVVVLRNYLRRLPGADFVGRWFLRRVLDEDVRAAASSLSHVPVELTARSPGHQGHQSQVSAPADAPTLALQRLFRLWRARHATEPRA